MFKDSPPIFTMHSRAHYMKPGAVAFIPGWIILFITILEVAILFPSFFPGGSVNLYPINSFLFAFIIGSLLPSFDDLFAFVFGPPFAHHSLFHSLPGAVLTYIFFFLLAGSEVAGYAFFGNLYHIFFNFYLDVVTLFFPFTHREFGLTNLTGISTYWLKVINYPIIFILFAWAIITFYK